VGGGGASRVCGANSDVPDYSHCPVLRLDFSQQQLLSLIEILARIIGIGINILSNVRFLFLHRVSLITLL
jgi:hypothetical protein